MSKKTLKRLMSLSILLIGFSTLAQTTTVSGVVSGEGMPLPGVSIIIKNTSTGKTTDFDGNFIFENIDVNSILVFSYVGFNTLEIPVKGKTKMDGGIISEAIFGVISMKFRSIFTKYEI